MQQRLSSWLAVVVASTLSACGSNGTGPVTDAGAPGSQADGSTGSACDEDASRVWPSSAHPVGQRLASGGSLSVRGVTSDGHVVFSDDAAHRLHAVLLPAGQAAATAASEDLGPLGSTFWVTVMGDVVFFWSDATDAGVGALSVWTPANGAHAVADASAVLLGAVSPDGTHILYVDGVDPTGATGDVSMATVEGSGATRLVTRAYVQGCFPQLGFVGSRAVASHCDAPPTGKPSATISSFSVPGQQRVDLMSHAANYWSASTATQDVLISTEHGILVVPIAGGPARTVDASGFLGQVSSDGQTAFYSTTTHGFRRSSTLDPAPITLVRDHFGGLYGLSPDERWSLFYWNMSSTGSDLFIASTVHPAPPVTLSAIDTATVSGDAFTTDSSHALYLVDIDPCTGSGTLEALPVGGASPRVLGQQSWDHWAAGAAKVVFTDHYVATGGLRYGRADMELADTSTGAESVRLVEGADAVFALSPAKDLAVYSWSAGPGGMAGIYAVKLP